MPITKKTLFNPVFTEYFFTIFYGKLHKQHLFYKTCQFPQQNLQYQYYQTGSYNLLT